MFLKKSDLNSVTFRLTFWYALLFSLLFALGFFLLYFSLSMNMKKQFDADLSSDIGEFETFYNQFGLKGLQTEFDREAEADGKKRVFFRLMSHEGEVLAASNLSAWKQITRLAVPEMIHGSHLKLQTMHVPRRHVPVRVATKIIPDGKVLQIGKTMVPNQVFLEKFKKIFLTIWAVMILLGIVVGLFMAGRAMTGVRRIAQAAVQVGGGKLDVRVPPGNEGREIQELAWAFNDMVERIQMLVHELQEVSDNVAHDLRSPLTRIRGVAETILLGEKEPAAFREMAGIVVEESDRLVEIINTMLAITQTESGVLNLPHTSVDMLEIVREARELFLPLAEDKSVKIEMRLSPEPMLLMGDKARLQRAVSNVLDNAVKFTSSGGKVIIAVTKVSSHIHVAISDTGQGINREELARIFDRFYRGEKSRSTPGNGLGLSLARAIARAHGGDISVESDINIGSTFILSLRSPS